jgi:hypothetical protein
MCEKVADESRRQAEVCHSVSIDLLQRWKRPTMVEETHNKY